MAADQQQNQAWNEWAGTAVDEWNQEAFDHRIAQAKAEATEANEQVARLQAALRSARNRATAAGAALAALDRENNSHRIGSGKSVS